MIMRPQIHPFIVRTRPMSFDFKQQTSALYLLVKVGGQMKSLMRLIGEHFIFRSFRLMSQSVSGSAHTEIIKPLLRLLAKYQRLTIAKPFGEVKESQRPRKSRRKSHRLYWNMRFEMGSKVISLMVDLILRPRRCLIASFCSARERRKKSNQFNVSDVSRARSGVIDSVCRVLCLAVIQPTTEKTLILFQSFAAVLIYSISRFQIAFSSSFWLLLCWSLVFLLLFL